MIFHRFSMKIYDKSMKNHGFSWFPEVSWEIWDGSHAPPKVMCEPSFDTRTICRIDFRVCNLKQMIFNFHFVIESIIQLECVRSVVTCETDVSPWRKWLSSSAASTLGLQNEFYPRSRLPKPWRTCAAWKNSSSLIGATQWPTGRQTYARNRSAVTIEDS